jgi:hypothetical protein
MKTYLLTLLYFAAGSLVNAEDNNTNKNEDMNTYKKPSHFGTRRLPRKIQRSSSKSCTTTGLTFPGLPAHHRALPV